MSKPAVHTYFTSSFPVSSVEIDGHEVTYEETGNSFDRTLSSNDRKLFQELLHEAQIRPKTAFEKALVLHKKNDPFKELDNLLAYLYLQNGRTDDAERLIISSFHKYPNYLFAKINYADLCLRKNKPEEIPLIFPSFALKDLFSKKSSFHVSEFRGFSVLISRYYLKIKCYSLAEKYYENAHLADPIHPSVLLLEKKFFPKSKLGRLFRKLMHLAHIS